MGAVVESRKLVLYPVARPVLNAPRAADVRMRNSSCPHEIRTGIIVLRLCERLYALLNDIAHYTFAKLVGDLHILGRGEVAFHHMRKHVNSAASRLIRRQRIGELRIQHRKHRTQRIARCSALEHIGFKRDDAVAGSFASGGSKRKNRPDRQRGRNRDHRLYILPEIEISKIPVVENAERDRLRRIDHAAAADGENEIDLLAAAKLYAFADESAPWIRHHTAKLDKLNAGFLKRGDNLAVNAVRLDASAAKMQKNLCAAALLHKRTDLVFGATTKNKSGR